LTQIDFDERGLEAKRLADGIKRRPRLVDRGDGVLHSTERPPECLEARLENAWKKKIYRYLTRN
jgi:hypothetical protein